MSYKLEKKLVENFKRYLDEAAEEKQLYCDMDGVLCDFEAGAVRVMNDTLAKLRRDLPRLQTLRPDRKNPEYMLFKLASRAVEEQGGDWGMTFDGTHIDKSIDTNKRCRDYMYHLTRHSVDWWATLPWMPGAKEGLWGKIVKFNPKVLSAPMDDSPESREGKLIWCKRELGYSGEQVILSEDKTAWGLKDGVQGVLIDDRDKYVAQFKAGGGIPVKHDGTNVGATIDALEQLGFSQQEAENGEEVS